jgi:hypothetical protein
MKNCFPCVTGLAAAVLAGSLQIVAAGEISGKVTLKGTPKPEVAIDLGPTCGPLNPNKNVTTRHYVTSKDGGLANVFVYLKDAKAAPPAGEAPVLDQIGCMYEPYIMGVVSGQKFKVKNSDATLHNVHNTPKPGSANKEYNIGQPLKGQTSDFVFEKAEILMRFKCDVHPWMFAYVGVVEHPHFAVTDKDGNFKITNVPDGKYTVVAYHLKTHGNNPGVTQTVDLKDTAKQDFTVEIPAAP